MRHRANVSKERARDLAAKGGADVAMEELVLSAEKIEFEFR